jgi:predicted permease
MTWVRSIMERYRALFRKGKLDAEMDEELRFHLEQETEKNLKAGMTPEEAHRQAMVAFGGVDRFKEQTREERGGRPLEDLVRDLRVGTRTLFKVPLVVVVTVVSLALGIATSATVFAVANGFLFSDPGPVRDPGTLVVVHTSEDRGRLYGETSFLDYQDLAEWTETLDGLAAHRVGVLSLGDPTERDRLIVELVTGDFFDVLGISPAPGRGFLPEETVPGSADRVIVLSHRSWMERFGGDPRVLGQVLQLDGNPFTVIGVAPEGLKARFFQMDVEGWVPLGIPGGTYRATPARMANRRERQFIMVGRLASGRTLEEAQAEFSLLAGRLHEEHGEVWEDGSNRPRAITVLSEAEARIPPDGRIALLGTAGFLLACAFLVLLLACSNVASLLLARAHRRSREMAIRTSLGAGRGHLVRMLLTESLLLALAGGGLGLYLTHYATGFLKVLPLPIDVPLRFDFSLDVRVVLFTLLLSLGASILAGIGPALQGSKPNLTPALKSDTGRNDRRGRRISLRTLLVAGQVATATFLIVGAGLAMRSLQASASFDVGLDASGVAIMWKEPPEEGLEPDDLREYYLGLAETLTGRPEVEAVALAREAEAQPLMDDFATARVQPLEGDPSRIRFNAVTPGYMEMLDIQVARGRTLQPTDRPGGALVAVVNQTFVDRFLPGTQGLGQRFTVTDWWDAESPETRVSASYEVVGVVGPRSTAPGEAEGPFFWTSFLQEPPVRGIIHARGRGSAESLVPILRREIPVPANEFTLIDPSPYVDLINYRFLGHRITSRALAFAGAFALFLAFIGVYGIVSFAVSQRFREMAIRQAMGARRDQVMGSVIWGGLRTTLVGLALGLAAVVPLAFLARSALLGVAPLDPAAVGGGIAVLVLAAVLAGAIPARRLLAAEPMEVLRDE